MVTRGWRGRIEVMSHGLTVAQGRHTGAIATSHGGTWMEETRSDVTWTQRDMRTCHSVAHGWRGHHSDVMWMRGQIEVMSHALTVAQGRHMGAIATSHCGTWMEGTRSDVTWTQRDTRPCHSMTRGWRVAP